MVLMKTDSKIPKQGQHCTWNLGVLIEVPIINLVFDRQIANEAERECTLTQNTIKLTLFDSRPSIYNKNHAQMKTYLCTLIKPVKPIKSMYKGGSHRLISS